MLQVQQPDIKNKRFEHNNIIINSDRNDKEYLELIITLYSRHFNLYTRFISHLKVCVCGINLNQKRSIKRRIIFRSI